jgi:hypothetical protein
VIAVALPTTSSDTAYREPVDCLQTDFIAKSTYEKRQPNDQQSGEEAAY